MSDVHNLSNYIKCNAGINSTGCLGSNHEFYDTSTSVALSAIYQKRPQTTYFKTKSKIENRVWTSGLVFMDTYYAANGLYY